MEAATAPGFSPEPISLCLLDGMIVRIEIPTVGATEWPPPVAELDHFHQGRKKAGHELARPFHPLVEQRAIGDEAGLVHHEGQAENKERFASIIVKVSSGSVVHG